ncbi:pancreatic triacylglycerol lipase-like [Diabrotica virgifera virgifera]|uniref:Lipase domain-containing protein n=1 Tax=Diabrotica virgifera virgifera TaxID=50390 RepID=A0ABM5JN76_DIAVI|nr:pancreatic triacylglycerol lipase-like [Diabrotica virgifera virgifera]
MRLLQSVVILILLESVTWGQHWSKARLRRQQQMLQLRTALNLKNRIKEKIEHYRERTTQSVCYDVVGCFNLPHKNSPLQKTPESPELLKTKFYLYTRSTDFTEPEVLYYDDNDNSLNSSSFRISGPLKVVVHGYMSKWNEKAAMIITNSYLKMYDCNVILMDWHMGARGPHYPVAAANTELVGRQLGILLTNMVKKGLDPRNIHLIGFSLGAHVSGTASESLKDKGYLLGRITGLDPASPLFRNNYLRENYKKLDRSDAKFVDIIHTDSSPFVTDGFGLWDPIGHVDFFPNGGQDQPGCNDVKDSIVVSHFEKGLSKELVCSHVRSFLLYREALQNELDKKNGNTKACEFIAYNCPRGRAAFEEGSCFPQLHHQNHSTVEPAFGTEIGRIGESAKGEGVMFFSTRGESLYCGTQLQAIIELSDKNGPLKGILKLQITSKNISSNFHIHFEFKITEITRKTIYAVGAADYNRITNNVDSLQAKFSYVDMASQEKRFDHSYIPVVYFNKLLVRDMFGNSWQYCKRGTKTGDSDEKMFELLLSTRSKTVCT